MTGINLFKFAAPAAIILITSFKIRLFAIPASESGIVSSSFITQNPDLGVFTQSESVTWPEENASYVAVYPYQDVQTITGTGNDKIINLSFPHTQKYTSPNDNNFISGMMISRVDNSPTIPSNYHFKNLFSILHFFINDDYLIYTQSAVFKDRSGKPVSGQFTVKAFEDEDPVFPTSSIYGEDNVIYLDLSNATYHNEYYMAVPPREYENGFELILENQEGKAMKLVYNHPITFQRGYCYTMNAKYFVSDARNDLSERGTANCYIVRGAGDYCFTSNIIGNGEAGLLPDIDQSLKKFHTTSSVISPSPVSAKVIWEDTESTLVSNVSIEGNKVYFTASGVKGNAVIAVYDGLDGTGKILWSWHIWATTNAKGISSGEYIYLDRNLGATGNTPLNGESAYGLHYQWGRKDPFSYKEGITITEESTIEKGTITKTIENPKVLLFGGSNLDWYSDGEGFNPTNYLWGNPDGKRNRSYTARKTIYDPCPAGYMVMTQDHYLGFTNGAWSNYGRTFNNIWFPSAGYWRWSDGVYKFKNDNGSYYSSTPSDSSPYAFDFDNTKVCDHIFNKKAKANACSIRCVKGELFVMTR